MTEDQERQMVVLLEQVAELQSALHDMTRDRDYYQKAWEEEVREASRLRLRLKELLEDFE